MFFVKMLAVCFLPGGERFEVLQDGPAICRIVLFILYGAVKLPPAAVLPCFGDGGEKHHQVEHDENLPNRKFQFSVFIRDSAHGRLLFPFVRYDTNDTGL